MPMRAGSLIGRYQIISELGSGSMGVVYKARDPKINRAVALKTISLAGVEPDIEREYRQRFAIEAQAAGRLSHPGIVTIFDVAEDDATGAPCLVMEFVEGESLEHALYPDNRRVPASRALQLAQEVAEALHYAHAHGVVHRDIKPANILVTADGHAKIADFGIAKLNQTQLTRHGHVLGSPAYMAPEQLSEEKADARSDLFSLGVILYFMLTGQRPFHGSSIATVCFRVVNHEPLAITNYDMNFPKELDAVVSRAIAKDPEQRYQSGEEMAADIQRIRENNGFVQAGNLHLNAGADPARGPNASNLRMPQAVAGSTAESGMQEATRALRMLKLTRTRVLALALITLIAFVLFSRDRKPTTTSVKAVPLPLAIETASPPPSPVSPAKAQLDLEIDHPFAEARASIWLDNQIIYSQVLHAATKNRMLIFHHTRGYESSKVVLPSGKHQMRVRVQSSVAAYDQSRTLAVNFVPNGEKILRVNCDKKHDFMRVQLQ